MQALDVKVGDTIEYRYWNYEVIAKEVGNRKIDLTVHGQDANGYGIEFDLECDPHEEIEVVG